VAPAPGLDGQSIVDHMTTTISSPLIDEHPTDGDHNPDGQGPRSDSQPRRGRWIHGRTATGSPDPRWVRPALVILLGTTAVLYLWGLGASGWANSFYAAAVQAGTKSWKAFFFGSFDASNFITVDKPPASLWVMEISARIFGLSSWSMLVPQALEGVATVGLLYATVKRWAGPAAGLIAGAVVALTPVAALMFRYNNPDALLVLLLTGAAYATVRAVESGRSRWLVLAMALVGTGFITKMMQAFLVVPAIGLVYLIVGPPKLGVRIKQLMLAAFVLVVASGWWVVIVELVPARDRPYIGGSQNNNLFNLIFGYNGFGRITGSETGSSANQWGATGWDRMFLPSFGSQISWLIPGALVLMGATLWITRHSPRRDKTRAAVVLFGTWLLVTGLLLSFAKGIIHPYYTVALAPAIGALVAIGVTTMWRQRHQWFGRVVLAVSLLVTTAWAYVLLGRSSSWMPELRVAVVVVGVGSSIGLLVGPAAGRRLSLLVGGLALIVALAAPAAYTIDTVAVAHSGAIPSAGPTASGSSGGPGGLGGPGGTGGFGGVGGVGGVGGPGGITGGIRGTGGIGTGAAGAQRGGPPTGGGFTAHGNGSSTGGSTAGARFGGGMGTAGAGGLLNASTPGKALTKLLETDASHYTWVVATVGSESAAGYQLATGDPVMSIGGFNGSDPTPTLAQFEKDVAAGKIHYFIAGGGMGGGGGVGGTSSTSTGSAITSWVEAHFTAKTVNGVTIYDLSSANTK
jgi:4-amino-4-deoxy-L-arabinose transferase-like glycosyltransferase